MTTYISELFPISSCNLNWDCFELDTEIERELGNRFSWRFSQQLESTIVTWYGNKFWVLSAINKTLPKLENYHNALELVQKDLAKDLGDRVFGINQSIEKLKKIPPEVIAELAISILRHDRAFESKTIYEYKGIKVNRIVDYWSELFTDSDGIVNSVVAITAKSRIIYNDNIVKFHYDYCNKIEIDTFLMDNLSVNPLDSDSNAMIVEIIGHVSEHRARLLALAKGKEMQEAIQSAPENDLVVSIKFKGNKKEYHYPISTLYPSINAKTANQLNVDYGEFLKKTKIKYEERLELIKANKLKAIDKLKSYGLSLGESINKKIQISKFYVYPQHLDQTKILFGNTHIGIRGKVIPGLKQGGVYRRHSDFDDPEQKIRISTLKIGKTPIDVSIVAQIIKEIEKYKFNAFEVARKSVPIENIHDPADRAQAEVAIDELLSIPTDLVFIILPTSDRSNDEQSEGSFYTFISQRILREGKSTQAIYQDTIAKVKSKPSDIRDILNNIVPGVLAKLGNLPYILADPLEIADYFIGFDVSRVAKKNSSGSRNVCAAVRVYGSQGEFISYNSDTDAIEGEEIDRRILEKFLRAKDLKGKRVLIYRDGRFRGNEIKNFLDRASAIESEFILVEFVKSKTSRLYTLDGNNLSQPPKGLWLQLSERELILVTTDIKETNGVPKPIRLKVIHQNEQEVNLIKLVEATLKLSLLHHGSLNPPGSPIPIFGADRIAYRVLLGNAPTILDSDRQWWL